MARRPENAVAPSWRGVGAAAASFATPPGCDRDQDRPPVQALSVAFPSEGSVMPAAGTAVAAGLAASAKIFGKKDTACARWTAGDFTKYAPAEALMEPRCLEADRVKNLRPAATPTRFFLRL